MSKLSAQTSEGSALFVGPLLRRLEANLRDLIIISCEDYLSTPGGSFNLTRLEYVSGENNDERYCMRFAALVREQERHDAVPIELTFIVNKQEN